MILERNTALLLSLVAELAAQLEREQPAILVGDAAEGYNPVHDLCRLIAGAAIAMAGVPTKQYEYAVVDHPHSSDAAAIVVELDAAEYAAKMERARGQAAALTDIEDLLSRHGADVYRREALWPVVDWAAIDGHAPPLYERYGEERVAAGRYTTVIRARAHASVARRAARRGGKALMRVLIAGHSLGEIGGVQRYERDLASWLLASGHSPVVYATELGDAARQLDALTIPVVDDLRTVTAPIDVIHGDSAVETMAAVLHFSMTPAIFVCHGWENIGRTTPRFPRILRYVAVDDTCADRLLTRAGIAPERVSVLLNAIDVGAFRQREPLPAKPRRAVVFGNLAHELTFVPAIREACCRAAIELDVVGASAGTAVPHPESILGGYDLAFAKAKCAMEAMACGLAVILCSERGVGGMVRSADFDRLRRLNFGIRALQKPLSAETLLAELALYDVDDAHAVSDRIRETASSDDLHESLFSTYEAAIAEHAGAAADPAAESRAAAAFLHDLAVGDRHRERSLWTLAKASQRVLRMPVVGPAATWALRRLIRRR